jgi:hypothetical protein
MRVLIDSSTLIALAKIGKLNILEIALQLKPMIGFYLMRQMRGGLPNQKD